MVTVLAIRQRRLKIVNRVLRLKLYCRIDLFYEAGETSTIAIQDRELIVQIRGIGICLQLAQQLLNFDLLVGS